MYNKINFSSLRTADIIVSTTGHSTSRVIREATGSSVSHSMLYTGGNLVVEAIQEGVVHRSIYQALNDAILAIVLRRRSLNSAKQLEVIQKSADFLHLPYDTIGAVGAGMTRGKRGFVNRLGLCVISTTACSAADSAKIINASPRIRDTKFFCSELVARSFELAGVPIVNGSASFANPRHVRVSNSLLYVGHLIDK